MKCIGKFKNDRICELCQIANKTEYEECLSIKNERLNLYRKLIEIESKCPYRYEEYSYGDREEYYMCSKKKMVKNSIGDDYCCAKLECEKYIK